MNRYGEGKDLDIDDLKQLFQKKLLHEGKYLKMEYDEEAHDLRCVPVKETNATPA